MPIFLKEKRDFPELETFKSVLIVPCRFCPAASMAVKREKPYFEFFRRCLKTGSYEQLIDTIQSNLVKKGVQADVFRSRLIHQFVICMWTSRRRKKLLKIARGYEAVVVLGCEAAVQTVHDALKTTSCNVFQGMRSEGVMTIKPSLNFPANISIKLDKIIPLVHQSKDSLPWVTL